MRFLSMQVWILVAASAAKEDILTVIPAENTFVLPGQTTMLVCKASEGRPLESCFWTPAYSTEGFPLNNEGHKADGGRLQQHGDLQQGECGVFIQEVQDKDEGEWKCSLSVLKDDGEVITSSGLTSVGFAVKPSSVTLVRPFDSGAANISADGKEREVSCLVKDAKPKPEFKWTIGDEELVGYDVEDNELADNTWMQTLRYVPEKEHDNQTLVCLVDHIGLDENDNREARVVLRFTNDDVDLSNDEEVSEQSRDKDTSLGSVIPIVAALIVLVIFALAVITFKYRRNRRNNDDGKEDVEAGELTEEKIDDSKKKENEEADDEEPNKADLQDEDEEKTNPKSGIRERLASFFRLSNRDANEVEATPGDNENTGKDGKNEEREAFVGEDGAEKDRVQVDGASDEDEKKGMKKEDNKTFFFSKIYQRFSSNRDKKEAALEIDLKEKTGDEDDKPNKDEQIEFEPEDKENKNDKKEEQKQPESKNTDV